MAELGSPMRRCVLQAFGLAGSSVAGLSRATTEPNSTGVTVSRDDRVAEGEMVANTPHGPPIPGRSKPEREDRRASTCELSVGERLTCGGLALFVTLALAANTFALTVSLVRGFGVLSTTAVVVWFVGWWALLWVGLEVAMVRWASAYRGVR